MLEENQGRQKRQAESRFWEWRAVRLEQQQGAILPTEPDTASELSYGPPHTWDDDTALLALVAALEAALLRRN